LAYIDVLEGPGEQMGDELKLANDQAVCLACEFHQKVPNMDVIQEVERC